MFLVFLSVVMVELRVVRSVGLGFLMVENMFGSCVRSEVIVDLYLYGLMKRFFFRGRKGFLRFGIIIIWVLFKLGWRGIRY